MDAIFKALNDPARRDILDSLRRKDGQTLSDLERQFDMTRFGVMKHLKVLEEASLVIPRRSGRFKHHYLNAVPLQEVIDRWIEPLVAKPQARALLSLKTQLETAPKMFDTDNRPAFVHQTFIRCTQDALWDALTRADQIAAYHFMCDRVEGTAAKGEEIRMLRGDGVPLLVQRVTRIEPKRLIEMTFEPHFGDNRDASRVILTVEVEGETCRLTCEHYDLPAEQTGVATGWARQIASLKSWLETGQAIRMAG